MEKYAKVSWSFTDVKDRAEELGIDLTLDQCGDFLQEHERTIQDDMVTRGWDSIETLLLQDFPENQ